MEEELRGRGRDKLIELNRRALRRGFSEAEKYLA